MRSKEILIEVDHVKAHRTKNGRQHTSLFEKFITEGNEKADELAKEGAMLDGGFVAQARASTVCSLTVKMIRSCKLKICSIPINHRCRSITTSSWNGRSQKCDKTKVSISILSWSSWKIKIEVGDSSTAAISSIAMSKEQMDLMRTLWIQMATKKQPSLLVIDCKSLYDAIHKERAAPSSTDKRPAIELATVKSRATEGEADLRWIDAR